MVMQVEYWQFIFGLFTLLLGVIVGTIKVMMIISKKFNDMSVQITTISNTLLMRVQLVEDALENKLDIAVGKIDGRVNLIERDVNTFKVYCEQTFLNKDTFNLVMRGQTSEREVMKKELIERINRMDERFDRIDRKLV